MLQAKMAARKLKTLFDDYMTLVCITMMRIYIYIYIYIYTYVCDGNINIFTYDGI